MASCSRYQFSPTCSSLLQTVFQQFLFFSSLTFFKYYPTARTLPQISSYSVTFVSIVSALSFSVVAETLNPKGLIAKNKSQSRENTEVNRIENPVRRAISALKTRKLTHRLTRRPNI